MPRPDPPEADPGSRSRKIEAPPPMRSERRLHPLTAHGWARVVKKALALHEAAFVRPVSPDGESDGERWPCLISLDMRGPSRS